MLIKICGLKYPGNIGEVLKLKPAFVGFNFYTSSPRYVKPEILLDIQDYDFGETKKVGVFVDESIDRIFDAAHQYNLDYVQLHGNETPEAVRLIGKKIKVIKAVGVETKKDIEELERFKNACDYLLLDKKSPLHGGTGQTFDWNLLEYYTLHMRFFVAGGISPKNIDQAQALKHRWLKGLDLNSGFEDSPGLKNIEKLKVVLENNPPAPKRRRVWGLQ
jgi:phosphoribosylanthranilate isomerase